MEIILVKIEIKWHVLRNNPYIKRHVKQASNFVRPIKSDCSDKKLDKIKSEKQLTHFQTTKF